MASTQGGICEVFAEDSLWNIAFMDCKFTRSTLSLLLLWHYNYQQIPGIVQLWGKALLIPVKEGNGQSITLHHLKLFSFAMF